MGKNPRGSSLRGWERPASIPWLGVCSLSGQAAPPACPPEQRGVGQHRASESPVAEWAAGSLGSFCLFPPREGWSLGKGPQFRSGVGPGVDSEGRWKG